MDDRFADLSPITLYEYETIGCLAFSFFNPFKNREIREDMGLPQYDCITPFSGLEFIQYLEKIIGGDYERKIHKIKKILKMMEHAGLLTHQGRLANAIFGDCYYALKELTHLQQGNMLWLGEAFGISFLQKILEGNVVHITGVNSQGEIGNGTGFLLNNKTVLTCKHVIADMTPNKRLEIQGNDYAYETYSSKELDIAVLVLDGIVDGAKVFPVFNDVDVLDEVLVMGYPPIPGSDRDYLLSQRGEVNAIVSSYLNGAKNLVLSSVTRPGSSGGPVISRDGYLVGMVVQQNSFEQSIGLDLPSIDRHMHHSSFYLAVEGRNLFDEIKKISPEIDIYFEDYR